MSRQPPSQRLPSRDALQARVVVVTDADADRGAGIARAMATGEAAVVLAGSNVDALGKLAGELAAAGVRVAIFVDDVATDAGRGALIEMVNELFPRPNT